MDYVLSGIAGGAFAVIWTLVVWHVPRQTQFVECPDGYEPRRIRICLDRDGFNTLIRGDVICIEDEGIEIMMHEMSYEAMADDVIAATKEQS